MSTKYIVNNLSGQTINGNPIDPTYKVYTALLTQSGSDGAAQGISASPLIVGATYYIEDNQGSGWDFTNVGAPNNDIGTYFVATGTTPNSWGIDGLLGYTPGAPVATVLENTIGNIWFTYDSTGFYLINSNGLFTNNKTWLQNIIITGGPDFCIFNLGGDSIIEVSTSAGNDLLYNTPIEIRVYN